MGKVTIDGKEYSTDETNVILDYTKVDEAILSGLTPTGETTIFTIDGIEIETKAKVQLEKGDGKQRLTRKPVKIPGANY